MRRPEALFVLAFFVTLTAGGCAEETHVVREGKRFLEGMPGAQLGAEDAEKKEQAKKDASELVAGVTSESLDQSRLPQPGENASTDPEQPPKDELVDINADGTLTLKARTVREVLVHLSRVLNAEGDEGAKYQQAFTRDILASDTKRHFQEQSKDATTESLEYLRANRKDINKLLSRMPAAENSPSVLFSSGGRNQFKLEVIGPASRGLKFTELWVANEKGRWKFMWVR